MIPAATNSPDDDELPPLVPLDTDEGVVDIPDEIRSEAWEESINGDDEVVGVDPHTVAIVAFGDDEAGEDDLGSPDDPMDALPEDDRGGWVGDEERAGDDITEIDEPARDHPDGGEEGPTRDPYDEVDTALPALDDGDDEGTVDESPSP